MEAASEGAGRSGGDVIGVIAPTIFPNRERHNPHVTKEIVVGTIAERIRRPIDLADAYVVVPGSLGTATELLVAWNDVFLSRHTGRPQKPLVVVGSEWEDLIGWLREHVGADASGVEVVADIAAASLTIVERCAAQFRDRPLAE
jgi:predicted Rossmann-fold nucleotide-binding protein